MQHIQPQEYTRNWAYDAARAAVRTKKCLFTRRHMWQLSTDY